VLHPDVVLRADLAPGTVQRHRGAGPVAEQALSFAGRAGLARRALVNGAAGLVVATSQQPIAILAFTVTSGRIVELDILADRARLRALPVGTPALTGGR
jgi:RNA polymerase sigma-70 factor (ECF subfamily)